MRKRLTLAACVPSFYWSATYLLRGILTVVGRWKAQGRENVPASGPVIIVCNHLSNADPPIISAGIARRRIRFMAKEELFHGKLSLVTKLWGAFPVKRFDADLGALLNAERLLKRGEVLGMFPEGTRSHSGFMGQPHPGTALIALRSGATVLPCAILGTPVLKKPTFVFTKPRISLTIGEPIPLTAVRRPGEAEVSELTRRIYESIQQLLPPEYRSPYTGMQGAAQAADGGNNPGV